VANYLSRNMHLTPNFHPDDSNQLTKQLHWAAPFLEAYSLNVIPMHQSRLCDMVRKRLGLYSDELQHLVQPHAGKPPLLGCLRLLIQYIGSYRPYGSPFLYP
jgi:hypothetical protein